MSVKDSYIPDDTGHTNFESLQPRHFPVEQSEIKHEELHIKEETDTERIRFEEDILERRIKQEDLFGSKSDEYLNEYNCSEVRNDDTSDSKEEKIEYMENEADPKTSVVDDSFEKHNGSKTINYPTNSHEVSERITKYQDTLYLVTEARSNVRRLVYMKCKVHGRFGCRFCESAKVKDNLTELIKTPCKENLSKYSCNICGLKTERKAHLTKHYNIKHHENPRIYACVYCSFKSKYKEALTRHAKGKHIEISRAFACNLCEFRSKRQFDLTNHIKMKHTENPEMYACKICEFKTMYKHVLKKHNKLKHIDAAETYTCNLCYFKTNHKSYLKAHFKRKQHSLNVSVVNEIMNENMQILE